MDYHSFLQSKARKNELHGFKPLWMPDFLFDFQKHLVDWAIQKGRGALFSDTGTGKTFMGLVWAENVLRKTNKPILIFTPLAVGPQFVREGQKFGIEVNHTRTGKIKKGINVTNYEQLSKFNPSQLGGVVCDESSILKHRDAKTRKAVTDFVAELDYRLLCTATPAPNDFMELGNSAEALGVMRYCQMLSMFFVHDGKSTQQWTVKGHARKRFWQWVAEWARAIRKPSDLGFNDDGFILPPLNIKEHVVSSGKPINGLFVLEAQTLDEQRVERRNTIKQRCEKVAEILPRDRPCLAWCYYNNEGDLLEKLVPDAVQIAGCHDDETKERRLNDFALGKIRVLVTKPKIGGFGLNFQHCADISFFPSHSHEQYYQAIRRCWRFGQKREVTANIVTSEGERLVVSNMKEKEKRAIEMYDGIVREMSDFQLGKTKKQEELQEIRIPSWL